MNNNDIEPVEEICDNQDTPEEVVTPVNEELAINSQYQDIIEWLNTVKFKKKVIGGLDPVDVWKKIEQLNQMYEKALLEERVRIETLCKEFKSYD